MNEITFTVKLNDEDFDDLERFAKIMGLSMGDFLHRSFKPDEAIAQLLSQLRKAEKQVKSVLARTMRGGR